MSAESIFNINDVETIISQANEKVGEQWQEETLALWMDLQKKAQILIDSYNSALNNGERITWSRLSKKILSTKTPEYIEEYQRKKELYFQQLANLHKVYPAAFAFDEAFTLYRGELPKQVAYVIIKKGVPTTYLMSLSELAEKASLKNRLFISEKNLKNEKKQVLEDVLRQNHNNSLDIEKHISYARAAYEGTHNRLQRYLTLKQHFQAQGMLLLFKVDSIWQIARVLNMGDVKEAYVAALMTEHQNDCLCSAGEKGKPKYYNHNLIQMFFLKYIHNITNRPAIIEEDVQGSNVQYSVKSRGANLPSLNQYIDAAREVLKYKNPMSKEEISTYLATQDSNTFRNNLVNDLNELTDEEFQLLLQAFADDM